MTLVLSTFLAWPANVPIVSAGPMQPQVTRARAGLKQPGPSLNRLERGSHLLISGWTDVVDNAEGSDGRDDSWSGPPAISDRPLDLPSLVPASADARPLGPAGPLASSSRSPRLRC